MCSCEDTMPLDVGAVSRGCRGANLTTARQLCRAELTRFRALAAQAGPLTVGCTQEVAVFEEMATAAGRGEAITYVNVRETAGWSGEAAAAGPKIAALLAAAAEPMPPVPMLELESEGVILIYGCDERAVEAGNLLKDHLDVTVLIKPPAQIPAGQNTEFPVLCGRIRAARGHFGAFEITVDAFAEPAPSSRGTLSLDHRATARTQSVTLCLTLAVALPCLRPPISPMATCAPMPTTPSPC